jgi:uncharacterized alkaline shock family protein YloU
VTTLTDHVDITDGALTQIVVRAAEAVAGVRVKRPKRHLGVDIAGGEARVSIDVTVAHGTVIPVAALDVQHRVADAVGTMCGVTVRSVDVNVEAVG